MMATEEFDDLETQIEALESRINAVESSLEEDIQATRKRIVQVKHETDGKAPRDHSHETLRTELDELEADIEAVQEGLQETESRLDGGFANFEEIVRSLKGRTETLETHVDTVGQALEYARRTLNTVSKREQQQARADHLKAQAATNGIRTAKCEACESKTDIALLSGPDCPHCGESFHTLDPSPGFFGTSILKTGDRPALEGDTSTSRPDLSGVGTDTPTEDKEEEDHFIWQSSDGNEYE